MNADLRNADFHGSEEKKLNQEIGHPKARKDTKKKILSGLVFFSVLRGSSILFFSAQIRVSKIRVHLWVILLDVSAVDPISDMLHQKQALRCKLVYSPIDRLVLPE
jgi:hypothetical protein